MKTAIVGCGKISQPHIHAILAVEGARICAVCDTDIYRARQVAELAGGANAYAKLGELLEKEQPDVVHILTPPTSHAALAVQAARAKCHLFVEKPMALSVGEAREMLAAAAENGVKLCVNHNYLFKPSIAQARELIGKGEIGEVIFVSGYYGLSGEGGAFSGDAGHTHWALRLPGGAFSNFLPHLIYLQMTFQQQISSVRGVTVWGPNGADSQPSEISVLLAGGECSGAMVVSMRAKPYAKFVDIYGTKGIIHADLVREVCTLNRDVRLPRMLSKVAFNFESSLQLASGTMVNTGKVLLGKMPNMPGLHVLVRDYYAALEAGQAPPVPGEDGQRVTEIMEEIWAAEPALRVAPRAERVAPVNAAPLTSTEQKIAAEKTLAGKRVLITGATGFLGHHLTAALARCCANAVALVRDESRVAPTLKQVAQLIPGDLRDPDAVQGAMRGVDTVFHCAAITTNKTTWREHEGVNIEGTRAVMEAALAAGVRRVIHVSSVIVYGLDQPANRQAFTESAPYPANCDPWAYYMRSKIAAEQVAREYIQKGLSVTILRLGILYGPGGGRLPGSGLMQLGRLTLVIGSGRNRLPFTYVGNAVDCMLLAAVCEQASGEVYNVVDDPQLTVREVVRARKSVSHEKSSLVPVPPLMLNIVARYFERQKERQQAQTPPGISRYVIRSAYRNIRYDTRKARDQLGWQSGVSLEEGIRRLVEQ